jgi:hypothetical protein
MTDRPRNIANDILDAVETATSKWTGPAPRTMPRLLLFMIGAA